MYVGWKGHERRPGWGVKRSKVKEEEIKGDSDDIYLIWKHSVEEFGRKQVTPNKEKREYWHSYRMKIYINKIYWHVFKEIV